MKSEEFTYGYTYHIYNRGINSCRIFTKEANYSYFIHLYNIYMHEISETYAWVLMPSHFHLLLKVKEEKEINASKSFAYVKGRKTKRSKIPSQQFSRLFNSYAQSFNKWNSRHGSLFERPFRRKKITDESYLKEALIYIHNNPVYHGYCKENSSYKWSSYNSFLSSAPSKINRDKVISWFGDKENFVAVHQKKIDIDRIMRSLGI